MSLLGTIESFGSKLLGSVGGLFTSNPLAKIGLDAAGSALGSVIGSSVSSRPSLPALPGVGTLPALTPRTTAARAAKTITIDAKTGMPVKKRRRRKGISGHDLQSFKRVARLIDKFAAPVHHLRKSSFKHKH